MFINLKNKIQGDKIIWIIIVFLSLCSLLAVYSATQTLAYKMRGGNTEYYLFKHFLLFVSGYAIMYVAHMIDYRYYSGISKLLLIASVILLIYTLIFGAEINQAKRWLTLPGLGLTFQTSDLAKLALIMFMARTLSKNQVRIKKFKEAFLPIIFPVLLFTFLIAPEDLSTAIVLFATCIILMFIGRVRFLYLFSLVGGSVLLLTVFVCLLFFLPEQKLKGRMLTWKNRIEAYGTNEISYQQEQANIAIAKGGILNAAPGNSTQVNFLPHPYSDYIYVIIIEEYGIVGGAIILTLYLLFLWRCIRIVIKSPKAFGALLAFGLGLSLVIQAMIHMGVTVGLLPGTGMTLPMVSMGGSSVWFTSFALGVILSVSKYIEMVGDNRELTDIEIGVQT